MAEKKLRIADKFALPLDLVTEATAIVATRGAGKSSASAVIVEESFPIGVQSVVFDRTGVYWGLRSDADGNAAGGLPIYVLGGPHGDVPLEPHAGTMIADLVVDSGHSFVLDLSDFSKAGAIKFSADFLERLYDRKARSRSTTLLVIDEAHFYAPQTPRGGFKGDAARLMGAMEDVVGLGRSRGLGVVLTTQRTQALNKAVLDLIETLFVMRMLSPRARDAVQDWIREKQEDDREGVIDTLQALPTGTAWVWSPLRGILEQVAIRRIRTFNSYRTPSPGEAAVEPSERKELDLDALGAQMQATVEKAKANDPGELRKELAAERRWRQDLEKTLDQLQAEVRTASELEPVRVEVEVEKIVEVPALTDAQIARVEQIVAKLDRDAETVENVTTALRAVTDGLRVDVIEALRAADTKPAPAVPARHSNTSQRQACTTAGNQTETRPAAAERSPRPGPRAVNETDASGGGSTALTGPQQRVLDAIAWYAALGNERPGKTEVGFIAGYRVGKRIGGTYGNILGQLTSAGLVLYPSPGLVTLTPEGRAVANDPGIEPTNEAFQQAVFDRLDGPEKRVLQVLVDAHPNALPKRDVGEAAGYTVGDRVGGTFGNILGRLRTLGLIDYPSPGEAVATPLLFPEGA